MYFSSFSKRVLLTKVLSLVLTTTTIWLFCQWDVWAQQRQRQEKTEDGLQPGSQLTETPSLGDSGSHGASSFRTDPPDSLSLDLTLTGIDGRVSLFFEQGTHLPASVSALNDIITLFGAYATDVMDTVNANVSVAIDETPLGPNELISGAVVAWGYPNHLNIAVVKEDTLADTIYTYETESSVILIQPSTLDSVAITQVDYGFTFSADTTKGFEDAFSVFHATTNDISGLDRDPVIEINVPSARFWGLVIRILVAVATVVIAACAVKSCQREEAEARRKKAGDKIKKEHQYVEETVGITMDECSIEATRRETKETHTVNRSGEKSQSGSEGWLEYVDGATWVLPCGGLLAEICNFSAAGHDGYVGIEWTTAAEIDNAGFNLHRSLSKDGEKSQLNAALILPQGSELQGADYCFADHDVTPGLTYYYWLEDVDLFGNAKMHGPVSVKLVSVIDKPSIFTLSENYPNPFKASTEIRYGLPEAAVVNLSIFDVRGQKIVTLVDERQPAGYKIARWDGRDDDGAEVSEGIYFTRMEADDYTATRKVVIVR